jgi:hypothetical protein
MIVQLNPQLPLLTPKGKAYAHFLIDYSQEHDLLWYALSVIPESAGRSLIRRFGWNPMKRSLA